MVVYKRIICLLKTSKFLNSDEIILYSNMISSKTVIIGIIYLSSLLAALLLLLL